MRATCIGFGVMGKEVCRHLIENDYQVSVFDIDKKVRANINLEVSVKNSLSECVDQSDIFLVLVPDDEQTEKVVRELLSFSLQPGKIIAVLSTCHPRLMKELHCLATECRVGLIDAPLCFGRQGAIDGNLVSLCGGDETVIKKITPLMTSFCREVIHVGPIGCGQIAKTCNNMLHWAACVANFEVLFMAKSCGIDAQFMREILLKCPAKNTTLERWDTTNFTWHEKDLDVALDLAQNAGLTLPLFGQIDQLVKTLGPDKVRQLLHGHGATYLGQELSKTGFERP